MDLSDWRLKLDDVDRRLVELLNERFGYVVEIAKIKKEKHLPVHEPLREVQVFENVRAANGGPLPDDAVQRVFERILDESRSFQRGPMGEPRKD
jgi:chorismate mutase